MNYKKKGLILSIFLIIIIQFLLFINNRQKTNFRYLIWNIQDVSIGRLIIFSFFSGLLMSSLLNKSIINNISTNHVFDKDHKNSDKSDDLVDREDIVEQNEITPERDLREPQPTISVNYRVIKNKADNELINKDQNIYISQDEDDWKNNNDSEW